MDTDKSPPILFPTDFALHSKVAFEHAEHLAADEQRRMIVLHVCTIPDTSWGDSNDPTYHDTIWSNLNEVKSDLVQVERVFKVADPGPEICRLAGELNCGMIFMGITNKMGMDQLICGSVHDYVLQNAHCPVVTLCLQPESAGENVWRHHSSSV